MMKCSLKVEMSHFFLPTVYTLPPGGTLTVSCIYRGNLKVLTVGEGDWTGQLPVEAHLDVLHAQDVPAVIHVLFEVLVLDEEEG